MKETSAQLPTANIEGVAFDLDGTLYPNHSLNIRLVPFILKEGRMLSAFGKARNIIRAEQEKDPSKICNNFYEYQAEVTAKLLSASAETIKEKIDRLIYRGWEPFFKKIKLFKHSKETLVALRKAGYKMGLLSDFPPKTKLEYLGISDDWDAILCSEECGALKPHPKSFIDLAKAMNLPPEKILYVGNSLPYDVGGAAKTGMKTAWIKNRLACLPSVGELSLQRSSPRKELDSIRREDAACASNPKKGQKPDFSFYNYRQLFDFMLK